MSLQLRGTTDAIMPDGSNVSNLNAEKIDSTVLLFVLFFAVLNAFNFLTSCNSPTSFSSLLAILGCRS